MNKTILALTISLLFTASVSAEYMVKIPLERSGGGFLPDNSIVFTKSPSNPIPDGSGGDSGSGSDTGTGDGSGTGTGSGGDSGSGDGSGDSTDEETPPEELSMRELCLNSETQFRNEALTFDRIYISGYGWDDSEEDSFDHMCYVQAQMHVREVGRCDGNDEYSFAFDNFVYTFMYSERKIQYRRQIILYGDCDLYN